MGTIGAVIMWAVFGLVVGAIARLLVPGRQPMGMLMTMIMGIVGSLVGGGIAYLFTNDEFHPAGWIMSIVGGVLVVWLYAMSTRRRGHHA